MTNQTIYNKSNTLLLLIILLCAFNSDTKALSINTPIISVPDTVEVCNQDSGIDSLCLNFNALAVGSTGTWTQDVVIPNFNFNDFPLDSVCFEGIQVGCYPFTFTTNTAVAPCIDTMATMMVCVKPCPCPSPATKPINPICNSQTINLDFALLTTDPGTWNIESGPAGQDISGILTGTIFDAFGIIAGEYVVRFTLDNPGGPLCDVFSEQTITVFEAPFVTAIDVGTMCNIDGQSDPSVLDLYELISVDASDGGTWAQIGGPMVNITGVDMAIIMSSDLTDFPVALIFEYTSAFDPGSSCPQIVVSVEVLVRDCNCPVINVLTATICNDGNLIDLNSLLTNDDDLPGTWTTDGNLVGTSFFDATGLLPGIYNITFTLDSVPEPSCAASFSSTIQVSNAATLELIIAPPPCNVDVGIWPTSVNLYDWLEPGYTTGFWEQTDGDVLPLPDDGIDMAIVDFVNQDPGEQFTYVFSTAGAQDPCLDKSVEIVITVEDCNCSFINIITPPSINNIDGILDMCNLVSNAALGTFSVLNQDGEDQSANIDQIGCNFNAIGLAPGIYSIIFTLDDQVPDICEQSFTVFLEVIGSVSTKSISKENIQIYPNPTSDILSIKSDYKINSINIFNTTGSNIYEVQPTSVNNVKIDLSSYPLGLYLLEVETDNGTWVEKVVRK